MKKLVAIKVVRDMETLKLLSWEGYEYDGPWDLAWGSGSSTQQQDISAESAAQSAKSYAVTEPGLETAENYYKALSSGDPTKIFSAVAPSVNNIIGNTQAAKQNILVNGPRGGTQDLALEQADISKASQIGNLQTQTYTSSFPALANLASTGMGLSVNEMANAMQGYQSVMQNDAQNKASTMGMFGSLAEAGGMAYACWIAAVVFRENFFTGPRVSLVRCWLQNYYQKTFFGKWVVAAYAKYGERTARVVARSSFLTAVFRSLFELALVRAEETYLNV